MHPPIEYLEHMFKYHWKQYQRRYPLETGYPIALYLASFVNLQTRIAVVVTGHSFNTTESLILNVRGL